MKRGALILLTLILGTWAVGQEPTPPAQEPSTPPAPVTGSVPEDQDQSASPAYEPSNQPLSGVQSQDIGTSSEIRNRLVPFVTLSQGWDSNAPHVATSGSDTGSGITNLAGGLRLNRTTEKGSGTSLSYMGGGQIYTVDSDLDAQFHRLDFSQNVVAGRWSFLMADNFSYQKDAFSNSPPMLFPGVYFGPHGSLYIPGVTPGESIIGQNVGRINNSSTGQVTYGFSRATSVTTDFSYGVLHYVDDSAYLSSRQWQAGTGLDHRFGRNTIGVNYSFTRFSYEEIPVKFDSHTTQIAFSHVLTGRWAFEASGGPAIIVSDYTLFKSTKIYGSGRVALHYHVPATDLSLQYGRSVTNGSGVLPGAIADDVGFTGKRQLSRSMTFDLSGGYSRNSGAFVNSSFNTFYVGTGISHNLGRYASVSFGYTGQRQTGTSYAGLTRHAVIVSFNWNFRPVLLH